jgi:hypothetical protein
MKYALTFILAALTSLTSCKKDDVNKSPVDQLPPATQEGALTFGCLINGEPFVVTNTSRMVAIYQQGRLQLGAEKKEKGKQKISF